MDRVAIVELIGATMTKTGLKVECMLDTRTYEKGIKVTSLRWQALRSVALAVAVAAFAIGTPRP